MRSVPSLLREQNEQWPNLIDMNLTSSKKVDEVKEPKGDLRSGK